MASNHFGNLFRITTWGESHGKAIGVVIDGCPAGWSISEAQINEALEKRAPGRTPFTSPRKEADRGEILSGVFEGKTTGAPLSIVIWNKDADSSKYEPIKDLLRPGHANFTYLEKYGIFDYRGGGRSSARETAARVAAGAVAEVLLSGMGVRSTAFMRELGGVVCGEWTGDLQTLVERSDLFCPDGNAEANMKKAILAAKEEGDSLGGVVELVVEGLPPGIGDPVYEKLEACLAKAMMTVPATKGVEFGAGFAAARMRGSEHNDRFVKEDGAIRLATNYGGGTLGGISTGMPLVLRVAFKPTSSIGQPMDTVDLKGNPAVFQLPEGSRHDPCVAIRGVPVVKAMANIALVDALMMQGAELKGRASF